MYREQSDIVQTAAESFVCDIFSQYLSVLYLSILSVNHRLYKNGHSDML